MLTDMKIRSLKATDTVQRIADRDGLSVEKRPSGKTVFIFRFQWNKKPQTMTLGHYPNMGLAAAREKALEYRSCVSNGIDPRELNAEKKQLTFKDVGEQWFNKNVGSWRDRTMKLHTRGLHRDTYPVIGNKTIDDITRADVLKVIHPHEEAGHHEVAHRLHDRIKAIFDYALAAGLTEKYPMHALKKALAPKPKIKNQVSIKPTEAHEMMDKIRNCNTHKIVKLYLELLAHLFTRPSELRNAKWEEFDLKNGEWHIPAERMKMNADHYVPLSPQVISMLRELRLLTGFTPLLFTSPTSKKQQPISEACARKVLHNLGYKGVHTLHGFRSLASTVLHSESSFRSDAIEAQLAHKVQGVRGVYMRAEFRQERRKLMLYYSTWMHPCSMPEEIIA